MNIYDTIKRKLCKAEEIWEGEFNSYDLKGAIHYATVSLPYTFNRMGYRPEKQHSTNKRLLHIVEGVVNQTILERTLKNKGYACKFDWSNYRLSDVFDFNIEGKIYDVKTTVVYSQYDEGNKRKPFSTDLLIKNKNYSGSKWRNFFPMMVPITQLNIEKMKDSYIFGIATTKFDLRKIAPSKGDKGFWCAAPYDKALVFFHNRSLIKARENASKGFSIVVRWKRMQESLNQNENIAVEMKVFGEWKSVPKSPSFKIFPGEEKTLDEFSSLSCIKIEHPIFLNNYDELIISVKNHLKDKVPKLTDPTIDINDDSFTWILRKDSFVNLRIPSDYKVYWLGYIPFTEFAKTFSRYPSYFIFNPNKPDENVRGMVTQKIRERLERFDKRRVNAINNGIIPPWPEFRPLLKGNSINAGLLIAAAKPDGKILGASCYYYPKYGLVESALYVLAKDLYTMDSL